MRTKAGEIVAVTHREQLETVDNVERYALSWTTGFWHETPSREMHKCDNARPPAVRYYRATEPAAGPKLEHAESEEDDGSVRVSFRPHDANQASAVRTATLLKQRDTWRLTSVHTARALTIMVKCAECEAQRGFALKMWLDETLVLGCYRCHNRVNCAEALRTRAHKHAPENMPQTHGLYRLEKIVYGGLDESKRMTIWAKCTGGVCNGAMAAFVPGQWLNMNRRLSCYYCRPGGHGRTPPERVEAIRAALKQPGSNGNNVARALGVSKEVVYKIIENERLEQSLQAVG